MNKDQQKIIDWIDSDPRMFQCAKNCESPDMLRQMWVALYEGLDGIKTDLVNWAHLYIWVRRAK